MSREDSGGASDGPVEDPTEPLPPGHFYRLAWIVYLILAVGGVVWIGFRLGTIPLSLFVTWDTAAADLGLGLAAGGLLIGAWAVMRRVTPAARKLEAELARMLGKLDTAEVVALAVLSGFAEEIFFRGAVQGALGWPIATLLFTVLHTGPGRSYRIWTVFAAIAGLLLAGLVVWRETLMPAIVAHTLVNGVNLRYLATAGTSEHID